MFEQTGVEHEEFELVQFVKGCQRMLHLRDIVDAIQHPGGDQPLDGFLKITRSAALADSSVHKFLVWLCQLGHNAAEHHQNASAVDFTVVFRKVVFVDLNQLLLNLRDLCRVLMGDPRGDTLRHSTDDQVIVECLQQPIVENFLDRLLFLDTGIVGVQALIRGLQKLVKSQRIDVQQIDHAHGIGLGLRQEGSQQTARGDHMVFVGLFLEIFQSI